LDWRNRNKTGTLLTEFFQNAVKVGALDRGANSICSDVMLKSHLDDKGKSRSPDPDDFRFFGDTGTEIIDHSHSAKLAFMDHRHAIAQGFGVGENVGGEENGLAFILELLNQLSNLMPSQRVQPFPPMKPTSGTRPRRSHQPDRFVSCRRRTATARLGRKTARKYSVVTGPA